MLDVTTMDLLALEKEHSSGTYIKREIQIVRGEGARLWDADGHEYIDCVGGQGAANLGHSHPAVVSAIQQQAATLMSCPEFFHNPVRARYQAALCEAAGMPRVYLCNSGAEAIESAIKLARVATGRTGIVAAMRGFHGRTMGALSATWNKAYREPFEPLVPGMSHVPFNNIDRLAEAITDQTAAMIIEPVQGEGGVHPAEPGYLKAAERLCHERGALLILDEIQTGFGRTGYFFGHEYDDVQPDLIALAKSIGGGVPMGAVLMGERVGALPPASHGSTFGGNPLACAAGLAVLDVLCHSDLIERARTRGEAVMAHLRENLPAEAIREVRGRGLLIGIELKDKVAPVLRALQARGVLALPAGLTVLRLLPPLVISDEDLWQAITIVEETISHAI
ncbi:MAG: acetylornithine/succinylornithine family transaminase [Anaerolineae bacterium]|nr:acetylornithine/succinylornithine family transaminase [Anaerolineae bacterium]